MADTVEKDPLAVALDTAVKNRRLTNCELMFADRPEVLESIRKAYKRKLSFKKIAEILSQDPDITIGEGAVRNYLTKIGDAK